MWLFYHMLPFLWLASRNHMKTFISQCTFPLDGTNHMNLCISQHMFLLADWNHMKGFISQHMILLDDKKSHECPAWAPQFLLAAKNQMDIFCENLYSDWSVYYIWTSDDPWWHDDVIWWCHAVLSYICYLVVLFACDRNVAGSFMDCVFFGVWNFKRVFIGVKFGKLWHCDKWWSWLVPKLEGQLY